MNLLLDTHTFLWFIEGDHRLSRTARTAIEDPSNRSFVSIASLWEMVIKLSLGKLTLTPPFETYIPEQLTLNGFTPLPISFAHLSAVKSLPFQHRDPFDRLLFAQSATEAMTIVSVETLFDAYGIQRMW